MKPVTIPKATVARLPLYLHAIDALQAAGTGTVSSEMLAKRLNVNAAKVRKDLSFLGTHGVRGVGYDSAILGTQIREALGLTRDFGVVIVGMGNLGTALANYVGFGSAGFHIVGIYDADEAKIGTKVGGLEIKHTRRLASDIAENSVEIGIIATPAATAQEVAETLEECGIRSILNFAQTVLQVEHAQVRRVDLSTELQILGYYVRSDQG
ncbi:MAG: redox-sensing transcriptional repressor Rex [Acidimicrobiia bacterium]|nr:redox-sensing transcriptional repressor Rex [Acidimicrobiia bacterium]